MILRLDSTTDPEAADAFDRLVRDPFFTTWVERSLQPSLNATYREMANTSGERRSELAGQCQILEDLTDGIAQRRERLTNPPKTAPCGSAFV